MASSEIAKAPKKELARGAVDPVFVLSAVAESETHRDVFRILTNLVAERLDPTITLLKNYPKGFDLSLIKATRSSASLWSWQKA